MTPGMFLINTVMSASYTSHNYYVECDNLLKEKTQVTLMELIWYMQSQPTRVLPHGLEHNVQRDKQQGGTNVSR